MTRSGPDQALLLLVELGSHDQGKGVLLGVDGALLQTDIDLGKSHRGRVGIDALPELNVVFVLHDTDFLACDGREVFIRF